MTLQDGRFEPKTADAILDSLMADAKSYFGDDLNDNETSVIKTFYRPIALRLAEAQGEIGLVLDSVQIDHAEGTALDLLTALVGVQREPATKATGEVTFSRDTDASQDYGIPKGTEVRTEGNDAERFVTTETTQIDQGTKTATASIKATEAGVSSNVGANTIVVMTNAPVGVEDVNNSQKTTGGSNEEEDEALRQRAKDELSEGSRASLPALYSTISGVDGVISTNLFVIDTDSDGENEGFEAIVEGGSSEDIAQAILDTKAGGDTSFGGINGSQDSATASLDNGQTFTIEFSRPVSIQIYVDADITVTDTFEGKDAVRDSIVNYIGGILSSGNESSGLGSGDDVIYGEIEYAIRDVEGVYDLSNLSVDTSSTSGNTSNISVGDNEIATSNGTDGSLTFTTTQQ